MTGKSASTALPIADLAGFYRGGEDRAAFLEGLREILHKHGFFYLRGHGVSPSLIQDALAASKRFFALPLEEKLEIEMLHSPHFRGYSRPGAEYTRAKRDWREQLDINTEAEALEDASNRNAWKRLVGPNQWPRRQPELKPLLLSYQAEVTRVGIVALRAISAALGLEEDAFEDLYRPLPNQLLKIVRYPGRDSAETSQGVGPHKDSGLVTVLLQDTVEGLQVQTEDGVWVDAPPIPGTFVINTGEQLELATSGYIRANVHGVTAPPAGVERFSIAFFLGARPGATVFLVELPAELKARQRGITIDPQNPLFVEAGRNELKSRLRSHPDVARRHHGDLLTAEQREGEAVSSAY
jgi:isopenicillin N synthase-like dioxygenase